MGSLRWCHPLQSPAIRHEMESSKHFTGSFVLHRLLSLEGKDQSSDIPVSRRVFSGYWYINPRECLF